MKSNRLLFLISTMQFHLMMIVPILVGVLYTYFQEYSLFKMFIIFNGYMVGYYVATVLLHWLLNKTKMEKVVLKYKYWFLGSMVLCTIIPTYATFLVLLLWGLFLYLCNKQTYLKWNAVRIVFVVLFPFFLMNALMVLLKAYF